MRETRKMAAMTFAVGACLLWLAIEAPINSAQGEEDNGQALISSRKQDRKLSEVRPDLRLPAARSSSNGDPDELRQALDQERDRADKLAQELEVARVDLYLEAIKLSEAEVQYRRALEQEQAQASILARQLDSLRKELDAARAATSKGAQANPPDIAREKALKKEIDQRRAEANGFAREVADLRAQLETERTASQKTIRAAEAAKREQELALGKKRDESETLFRELASARKELEERSRRLAAADAEISRATETNRTLGVTHNLALAGERDRADALARELGSARNELEAARRQVIVPQTFVASPSYELASDRFQKQIGKPSSKPPEENGRNAEQLSGRNGASNADQADAAKSRLADSPDASAGRGTSVNVVARSPATEQRLLARANALLGQADISGARPLLEHALENGSARAAFMLAETYDARILQSWDARGVASDIAKARQLYERAEAGGIEESKERIKALK